MYKDDCFHISFPILDINLVPCFAVWWYLLVLICISLIKKEVVYFFHVFIGIYLSFTIALSISLLGFLELFFVRALYMSNDNPLLCMLEILSPSLSFMCYSIFCQIGVFYFIESYLSGFFFFFPLKLLDFVSYFREAFSLSRLYTTSPLFPFNTFLG